jgi:hypothetical protein
MTHQEIVDPLAGLILRDLMQRNGGFGPWRAGHFERITVHDWLIF